MDVALRKTIRRLLVLVLLVGALGVGYSLHGVTGSPTHHSAAPVPTRKLTAADLLLAASTAQGIHMRYTGITTGPLTPDHANDIPITSFQFGDGRAVSGGAGGAPRQVGLPNISEITLTHQFDQFSLPLLNSSLRGQPSGPNPQVNLYFTNLTGPGGGPVDFLEIDLQSVVISGYSTSSGGDAPSESISLNFVGKMTFKAQVAGGATQTVNYNLTTQS